MSRDDASSTTASGGTTSPGRGKPFMYRGVGPSVGPSYFLEKQAVVIDFGRSHTKVGFATESRPRQIFPSPELRVWRRRGEHLTSTASEAEWIEILARLMAKIFFHHLNVSPKDRKVVICDSVHSTSPFRVALAHVLFKRFSVPTISFVIDLVLPLYLTGLNSGIVIDCGYESTRVLATFAGVPLLSAYSASTPGGRHINLALRRGLRDSMPQAQQEAHWLDDEDVTEDLKTRACYVACESMKTDRAATFTKKQQEVVCVPALCRWQPAEVLFEGGRCDIGEEQQLARQQSPEGCCEPLGGGSLDRPGVAEAFAEMMGRLPIDVRPLVVQNVVVVGGCAMLKGLLPRLAIELRAALQRHFPGGVEAPATLADRLLFTPLEFAPVCATWVGGAIFAALEGAGDYTAEDYAKSKPLPDWTVDGFV